MLCLSGFEPYSRWVPLTDSLVGRYFAPRLFAFFPRLRPDSKLLSGALHCRGECKGFYFKCASFIQHMWCSSCCHISMVFMVLTLEHLWLNWTVPIWQRWKNLGKCHQILGERSGMQKRWCRAKKEKNIFLSLNWQCRTGDTEPWTNLSECSRSAPFTRKTSWPVNNVKINHVYKL